MTDDLNTTKPSIPALPILRRQLAEDSRAQPLVLRLQLLDGSRKDLPCPLPLWDPHLSEKVLEYTIFNLLSVYSGRELCIFLDPKVPELMSLFDGLATHFQLASPRRGGLGKVISIAHRLNRSLGHDAFSFRWEDIRLYSPLPAPTAAQDTDLCAKLQALAAQGNRGNLIGIDIGGTDIKLAASRNGELKCIKEFDWDPSRSTRAEEILEPILLLLRLMRACLSVSETPLPTPLIRALRRKAGLEEIRDAVFQAEAALGSDIDCLDGVGISFPDIVIQNRILGGETPKTKGLRENPEISYETEFAKLSELRRDVLQLCRKGAVCRICNDGNMAAFTAAIELALGDLPEQVRRGVVAHTLGTDLGTGWLLDTGAVPQIPLELYDLLLDLSEDGPFLYPPEDLRSTRNENSGLAGVRRYLGQAAAFRLAWELEPALLRDFVTEQDGILTITKEPQDLRKACLEHLMLLAEQRVPSAEEIFRRIGEHLALVCMEMDTLLTPEPSNRYLFGRFVKSPHCFALICQGFRRLEPNLRLLAADEGLANTPLMKQLSCRTDATVAQFGQAVGAIYFANTK